MEKTVKPAERCGEVLAENSALTRKRSHVGHSIINRVSKWYAKIRQGYEFHPGSKSADPKGQPSAKQTLGLLQRRHIWVEKITYIGKESNNLEEVESGTIHSPQSVLHRISRPETGGVAKQNPTRAEEIPNGGANKIEWPISSNAYKSFGRSQPTTPEKSGTTEINLAQARHALDSR